jgi:hypothetical protein
VFAAALSWDGGHGGAPRGMRLSFGARAPGMPEHHISYGSAARHTTPRSLAHLAKRNRWSTSEAEAEAYAEVIFEYGLPAARNDWTLDCTVLGAQHRFRADTNVEIRRCEPPVPQGAGRLSTSANHPCAGPGSAVPSGPSNGGGALRCAGSASVRQVESLSCVPDFVAALSGTADEVGATTGRYEATAKCAGRAIWARPRCAARDVHPGGGRNASAHPAARSSKTCDGQDRG